MLSLLLRSQLRFAVRTPLSTLSALLGLTLGIASVVSVHLICERIVASLDQAIPVHLQSASHVAHQPSLNADDYFALRARWRSGELATVQAMAPLLEGEIELASVPSGRLQVYGIDWLAWLAGNRGVDNASPPASEIAPLSNQVLVSAALNWPIGSKQTVAGMSVQVADQLPAEPGLTDTAALYTDIAVAVDLLGPAAQPRLSAVLLQVVDPLARVRRLLARLLPGVDAGLPPPNAPDLGPHWRLQALDGELPEQSFGRSVLFNLGALGSLSLVVAWFLMFQTALLWLRRQQRVFRLLRDQGVNESTAFLVFCLAMLTLGLIAGVLGIWFGQYLASELITQFSVTAAEPFRFANLSPWLWLKAGASALAVPLLSALLAFRITRRDASALQRAGSIGRWLFVCLAGVLTLVLLLRPETGLFGAFTAILLACVIATTLLLPLIRLLRQRWLQPVEHARGLSLRMGARELLWYPSELGAALAALTLAVATSIGIGTLVESFRLDFVRMLEQRLADDIRVEGPAEPLQQLYQQLSEQQVALTMYTYGRARTRVQGKPLLLGRSQLDARGAARYGLQRALGADEVMLNQRAARGLGLTIGETLLISEHEMRVAHVFPGYGDASLRALIAQQNGRGEPGHRSQGAMQRSPRFELYRLGLATPEPEAVAARVQAEHPTLTVGLRSDARQRAVAIFDRTFAITRSLTWVALFVAAVGLYSAMVALGLTQSHTRTLLMYLGQRRRDRWLYVSGRALAVGLVTVILAVPLGLLLGAMLCYAVNPRGFGWSVPMTVHGSMIYPPLALALLAAFTAGLVGDRREAV